MSLGIRVHRGAEIVEVIEPLAHLRITVFRDWPYLYDGNMEYERLYLADYAQGDGMVCSVWDAGQMVGASTAMPLAAQPDEVRAAFDGQPLAPSEVYYCAESVLLPGYRGRGLGHRFFDEREAVADELGFKATAFCAVIRDAEDPRKPDGYRPLDAFWTARGYAPLPGALAQIAWRDIGAAEDSIKPLQFWTRAL